jgi:hypothetical protein
LHHPKDQSVGLQHFPISDRGDILLYRDEFGIREGQLPKSHPMLMRRVPRDCSVRTEEYTVETKLPERRVSTRRKLGIGQQYRLRHK